MHLFHCHISFHLCNCNLLLCRQCNFEWHCPHRLTNVQGAHSSAASMPMHAMQLPTSFLILLVYLIDTEEATRTNGRTAEGIKWGVWQFERSAQNIKYYTCSSRRAQKWSQLRLPKCSQFGSASSSSSAAAAEPTRLVCQKSKHQDEDGMCGAVLLETPRVRLSRSNVHGQNNRINSGKLIHKCGKFIISDFAFRFQFWNFPKISFRYNKYKAGVRKESETMCNKSTKFSISIRRASPFLGVGMGRNETHMSCVNFGWSRHPFFGHDTLTWLYAWHSS